MGGACILATSPGKIQRDSLTGGRQMLSAEVHLVNQKTANTKYVVLVLVVSMSLFNICVSTDLSLYSTRCKLEEIKNSTAVHRRVLEVRNTSSEET